MCVVCSEGITTEKILTPAPYEHKTLSSLCNKNQVSEEQETSTSLSSFILAPLTPIIPPAKLW